MTRYVQTITDAQMDSDGCILCAGIPDLDGHTLDCPMSTDVWQIGPRELDEGFSCTVCSHLFADGEHYTGRDVVCLGCAASGREAA